jgi:alpha-L-fucosidase
MKTSNLAKPTEQQMKWQDLEIGMFCHFGMNTFHDQEWGEGTDSPETFNPSSLNARQWVKLAKEAGFKYFILTAKHHDGFCLWPTATTDYSVKSSPWKDGKGDILREVAEACQEQGMLFGLYLSPWDRHEPCYSDKEAYDDFYCQQLTELLTNYGPLVEVWFDGAGSEGREYDWKRIIGLVKKHQPNAMIFNMGEPTIRWVGNEDGVAPYPCWNTAETAKVSMYTSDMLTWMPETPDWVPAECDVPIRKKHWFWHPNDEQSLLSLDKLMDIYYRSVGHGTNLLLNVAPDNRGLIPDVDVQRVQEFGKEIKKRFANSIAETSGEGNELVLSLSAETVIDHVILMEEIAHGERVRKYVLEAKQGDNWVTLVKASAVGHKKIDQFDPVTTDLLRLRVLEAVATPLISRLACFYTKTIK